MNPIVVTISVAVIAVGALAGAIFLQWQGEDSTNAWVGFGAAIGVLTGQQMETPTGKGTSR